MIQTILAALGTVFDALSAMILAVSYGFAAFPVFLGFLTALLGIIITGEISPISSQSETIILIGKIGENRNERLTIAVFAESLVFLLGISGLIGKIVDFMGIDILHALMAGVAVLIAQVSITMLRKNLLVGSVSFAVSVLTFLLTENLVYTVVLSVLLSIIVYNLFNCNSTSNNTAVSMEYEKLKLFKPVINSRTIRGSLGAAALLLGGTVSDCNVNAQLAGLSVNVNNVITYTGLGGLLSSMFGGMPLAVIISGTAASPMPKLSACIMMSVLVLLMVTKFLPRVMRYIPTQAISGFLFTLSAFVIFPQNAIQALTVNPLSASLVIIVTAVSDPCLGIIAGIILKFFI